MTSFLWPLQAIPLWWQKAVNGTQFSYPCSSSLQLIQGFRDCLKQARGRREREWPYPGHQALCPSCLWSYESLCSVDPWLLQQSFREPKTAVSIIQSSLGASLEVLWVPDQLELARGAGTRPSLPSFVPSTALLEQEARAILWNSIPSFFPFLFNYCFFSYICSFVLGWGAMFVRSLGLDLVMRWKQFQNEKTKPFVPKTPNWPLDPAIFFLGFQTSANSDHILWLSLQDAFDSTETLIWVFLSLLC